MAPAAPKISSKVLAMRSYSILAWPPAGQLIARASAGFPFRDVVALAEDWCAGFGCQKLHFFLAPAFDHVRNGAARFHQEQRRHARNPESVARWKAAVLVVEQSRKRDAKIFVELARVARVVLRDAVDRESPGRMEALQKRKRQLADRAGDLEEGQQRRPASGYLPQANVTAAQKFQADIRHGRAGIEKLRLSSSGHASSVRRLVGQTPWSARDALVPLPAQPYQPSCMWGRRFRLPTLVN